jgi:hypothetical protein
MKKDVKEFFTLLPYVLPCKFCRASLIEYYEKEHIEPALESRAKLEGWLYKVHNHVNEKLHKQGLLNNSNPSFESVKKVYEERVAQGCMRTSFEGWDFLFSIAENHPFSRAGRTSSPMPGTPEEILKSKDPVERNRWNIMTAEERIPFYIRFWKVVGNSLPFAEWRQSWIDCKPRFYLIKNRIRWRRELWRIRCCLEKKLELINKEKYDSVCMRLMEHKSGCNKTKKAKTCRRLRTMKKKNK